MAYRTLNKERGFGSLKKDLTQMGVGLIIWLSLTALWYFSANQPPVQASQPQALGSGFRSVPQRALTEWKFDKRNPVDSRIRAMDNEEKFIGTGQGFK